MTTFEAIAIALITLGGILAVCNWLMLYLSYRSGRFHSSVPSFLFLIPGMLILPSARLYVWLAPILDPGTFFFLRALPTLFGELWSTSRFNLVEQYVSDCESQKVVISLFRKGVYTIKADYKRGAGEHGLIGAGSIGTWERAGNHLKLLSHTGVLAKFMQAVDNRTIAMEQSDERDENPFCPGLVLRGIDLAQVYSRKS